VATNSLRACRFVATIDAGREANGMPKGSVPPVPDGAQVNQSEWEQFYEYFGHARLRRAVRVMSRLPSAPRCEACGNPFSGWGGALMRRLGKGPSRKNPRWCELCFEKAPEGGATLTIGVLFADVRGSTALGERVSPEVLATTMNRFYAEVTQVVVRHGIVDKLIGDEVMGLYLPALTQSGRYVDAMVSDAHDLLRAVASATDRPHLDVGIGLAIGPAFVGMVGQGHVRDFTALGDVVNVAARLQARAAGGQIVMTSAVADLAAVHNGEIVEMYLKGKTEPLDVRIVTISA
jgi:adenylate cyclase